MKAVPLFLSATSATALTLVVTSALAADPAPAGGAVQAFGYLTEGGPVVIGTLILLIGLSFVSWAIIGIKWIQLGVALKHTRGFVRAWEGASTFSEAAGAAEAFPSSPLAGMMRSAKREMEAHSVAAHEIMIDSVQRGMRRAARDGVADLEARLGFLGTVASAAPFIGLFGTVWGIMDAFAFIRPDQPILTTVAPHIAHALIATAVGLATAIPAVMAYNFFVGRVRVVRVEIDGFGDDLLNRVNRARGTIVPTAVARPVEGAR